ncbi:Mannonate dehydratase [Roseibaca ekhonensis]|uniref:mannonate dehydratase n=2 Tax=Roseinatronobacter ekhonensis TaxID=254356 RepID=A0A3B0MSZ3_9RHOB|nr:Mannonate dehydratase [Roseibaca ekhonensis]
MIVGAGLTWSVVESIPVPEAVKLGQDGCDALSDMWAQSALNLAQQGITTICYNFMPVLDWTRTELRHRLPDGAECLRFDRVDLAVFDMFILKRPAAVQSYGAAVQSAAATRFKQMDAKQVAALSATILAGLPGAETSYSLSDCVFRGHPASDSESIRPPIPILSGH